MDNDGTVSMEITWVEETGFLFREVANTTDGSVEANPARRLFDVLSEGTYHISFTAANFTLADPPIGFPSGDPDWLKLQPGYTDTFFQMKVFNGTTDTQSGTFLIHKAGGPVVDPTVVNNPPGGSVRRAEKSRKADLVGA